MPTGDAGLVLGPSGAGKTIFCLRYIAEGLARDEHCLYITFQDTADQLIDMATGFGWNFLAALDVGRLTISHIPMGSVDLDMLASIRSREYIPPQTKVRSIDVEKRSDNRRIESLGRR
jgi:circadian clock protein KaiC